MRASIEPGRIASKQVLAALDRLEAELDPVVREHAVAIISALLRGRPLAATDCVAVETWVDEGALHVEVGDGCLDLRPETLARGFRGVPLPAFELIERLTDRWGIAYDGELRLWFEIAP